MNEATGWVGAIALVVLLLLGLSAIGATNVDSIRNCSASCGAGKMASYTERREDVVGSNTFRLVPVCLCVAAK